jgi:hypothetical protein
VIPALIPKQLPPWLAWGQGVFLVVGQTQADASLQKYPHFERPCFERGFIAHEALEVV